MIGLFADAKAALKLKQEESSAPVTAAVNVSSSINTPSSNNNSLMDIKSEKMDCQDAKDTLKDENKVKKEEAGVKEAAKPQDKSRPISSTPVPGTPWFVF